MLSLDQKICFHLHGHSIVKLLHGLVVDGYGHLCVSVEGELYIVAGPVLPLRLVTRQLQVLAAPTGGGGGDKDKGECFQVENRNMSRLKLHLMFE